MRQLMLSAGFVLLISLGCAEKNPRTVPPSNTDVARTGEVRPLSQTTSAQVAPSAAHSPNAGLRSHSTSAVATAPAKGSSTPIKVASTTPKADHRENDSTQAKPPQPVSPPGGPMIAVLPNGPTGQLLWERLTPTPRPGILANPARQPRSFAWARETALEPLLPPVPAPMPRLPRTVRPVRPQPAFEEALAEDFAVPRLPARPGFTPSERVRDSGEDARLAPPLPYLASPPVDRVPLDDPTLPAATRAILAAPIPVRSKAMPFEPIRLPEPYEFRQPQVTPQPEEETTPAVR